MHAILCVFTLMAMTASCAESQRELSPLTDDAVILAFGDSLTYGYGARPDESYPAVLEKLTNRRVVNAGVNGDTTADGLRRLPRVLADVRPDLTLLCLGGNDMLQQIPDQIIAQNLAQLIGMIRESGSEVVLLAIPRPGLFVSAAPFYEQAAEESGAPLDKIIFIEVYKDPALKYDPIHPNARGYAQAAQAIAEMLERRGALVR